MELAHWAVAKNVTGRRDSVGGSADLAPSLIGLAL
jgi:hypothetical protein